MINTRNNNLGFTLIEILTVVAIIGMLATLSFVSLSVARERAKIANAQNDMGQIRDVMMIMALDTNEWPGHQTINQPCSVACDDNELCGTDASSNSCTNSLTGNISGLIANHSTPYKNWSGPYLKLSNLEDPWGNEYFFDTDYSVDVDGNPCTCSNIGCHDVAVIGSFGPDGLGVPKSTNPEAYGCDDIIIILAQ